MCFPERREVECRFFQDPDGISDLEYNLIDNWHRLNSGFAVKRFRKFAKEYNHTYSLIFGDNWKKYSKEYADSLTEFEFAGYWHGDIRLLPFYKQFIYKCRRGISLMMPKKYRKTPDYNYFPGIMSVFTNPGREEFYKKTQDFCEKLISSVSDNDDEYFVMDQAVSTTNIARYLNYVSDLKVIIVDRDPRDLYVQGIEGKTHVLPHDVEKFAAQYIASRSTISEELKNKNVLYVQFEDLIYKYDESTERICGFLGLDENKHTKKREYFNPDISIKNTQMWKTRTGYEEQLRFLDKTLSGFYYDFPE